LRSGLARRRAHPWHEQIEPVPVLCLSLYVTSVIPFYPVERRPPHIIWTRLGAAGMGHRTSGAAATVGWGSRERKMGAHESDPSGKLTRSSIILIAICYESASFLIPKVLRATLFSARDLRIVVGDKHCCRRHAFCPQIGRTCEVNTRRNL